MTPAREIGRRPVLRLALTIEDAAASIGCSRDFFDEYVRDELRLIRKGRKTLVPCADLERWVDRNAALTLEGS